MRAVATCGFPLPAHDFVGKAASVIDAKEEGVKLCKVEAQAEKHTMRLPGATRPTARVAAIARLIGGIRVAFASNMRKVYGVPPAEDAK